MTQFFDQVSHCIETHGGTVEKFAGDAVMAAFGIPQAHEDDAERAVRAALAILDAVARARARGADRHRVGRGRRRRQRLDVRHRRGRQRRRPPPAGRRAGPDPDRPGRARPHARPRSRSRTSGRSRSAGREPSRSGPGPRVGVDGAPSSGRVRRAVRRPRGRARAAREHLRARARATAARTSSRSTASRASARAGSRASSSPALEGATVLAGRCLPYGEGITYWPLAEMVKASAGIADDDPLDDALEKLRDCCEDEAVADLLGLATGVLEAVHGERSQQEIAWAAREWAQQLADVQPLVLVFEDIHWAEEPLLELIEHLADLGARGAAPDPLPRPARAARRPLRLGRRPRARDRDRARAARPRRERAARRRAARRRRPLSAETAADAARRRPRATRSSSRRRCACSPSAASEAARRIPDTLQALIAARIDRLPRGAKARAPARLGDRPHLLARRDRAPRAGRRGRRGRCSTTCCSATSSLREPRSTISGEQRLSASSTC